MINTFKEFKKYAHEPNSRIETTDRRYWILQGSNMFGPEVSSTLIETLLSEGVLFNDPGHRISIDWEKLNLASD
jgi:hypothetical protein